MWQDKNDATVSADTIRNALDNFGTYITDMRARIKKVSAEIESASTKKDTAKVAEFTQLRQSLQSRFQKSVETAATEGYPATVRELGNHHKLVSALSATLIDCIRAEDFVGPLPTSVLHLMSKFNSMTDSFLERLKFDSIKKRWAKKGNAVTNRFIETIISSTVEGKQRSDAKIRRERAAADAEAAKLAKTKLDHDKQEAVDKERERLRKNAEERARRDEIAKAKIKTLSSASKRPREGDEADDKSSKKFAAGSASDRPVIKAPISKRPSNLLANNLLTSSLRPAPKLVTKKAAGPSNAEPETESKFGALMDSITKPPPEPKKAKSPERPPETPAEKAKRERKESRRHLRVKFKDGADLEQIRLFKHEQAEDEGRREDMLRDAFDNRSEGMMLKKRMAEPSEADEEEDKLQGPYPEPMQTDLQSMAKSTRHGSVLATRGGAVVVDTTEQRTQRQREASELMVIYNNDEEIPPTPREPPRGETGSSAAKVNIAQPSAEWLHERLRLSQTHGPAGVSRSGSIQPNHPNFMPAHQGPVDLPIYQKEAWDYVSRVIEAIKHQPHPASTPPVWMGERARAMWLEGYNRDHPPPANSTAFAQAPMMHHTNVQASSMGLASHTQDPPPIHPSRLQHHATNSSSRDPNQQVADFLAAMNPAPENHGQGYAQHFTSLQSRDVTNSSVASQQAFEFQSWPKDPQTYTTMMQQSQTSPAEDLRNNASQTKQRSQHGSGEGVKWRETMFDENGDYLGKKRPCTYYREGRCVKGAKCTFLHE